MSTTNTHTIPINASSEKVWLAFTTSQEVETYMENMKVVSGWKVGSPIVFTCYNSDGSVMIWNDKEMIWSGEIVEMIPNQKFVVNYHGNSGLVSEMYELDSDGNGGTNLTFTQVANTPEVAKNYQSGNLQTLELLKLYCEKN
jgi:uncharacterized protein YndB with AHSA1/START domain